MQTSQDINFLLDMSYLLIWKVKTTGLKLEKWRLFLFSSVEMEVNSTEQWAVLVMLGISA